MIITDRNNEKKLRDIASGLNVLIYEEAIVANQITANELGINQFVFPSDICFVMYTSGSTGEPKGVITSHRALINRVESYQRLLDFSSADIFANQFPLISVSSVANLYLGIKLGITNYQIGFNGTADIAKWTSKIAENHVSALYCAVSMMSIVSELKAHPPKNRAYLKYVIFGGEAMPSKVVSDWQMQYPNCRFMNLYGATETVVACMHYTFDCKKDMDRPLPIGTPLPNSQAIVIDENKKRIYETDTESIGELYIVSDALASGYYRNNAATKLRFVQNPLHNDYEEIVYRTGDLVRYNIEGELVYIGRRDNQISYHGHRVELEDIEVRAASVRNIGECACAYDADAEQIILFYSGETEEMELYGRLHDILPIYMLPTRLVRMDELPHNANGKIDRMKLQNDYIL